MSRERGTVSVCRLVCETCLTLSQLGLTFTTDAGVPYGSGGTGGLRVYLASRQADATYPRRRQGWPGDHAFLGIHCVSMSDETTIHIPPKGTRGTRSMRAWMLRLAQPLIDRQVERYRRLTTPQPATFRGFPMLLLSTVGAKSGHTNASIAEQCIALGNRHADDIVPLQIAALDQYADLNPDFIKMDVEGAEIDALAGASAILRRRPALYVELHPEFLPRFGRAPMDLFRFVSLDDYFCFINYPGKEPLLGYALDFELTLPCGLFFVPKDRPPARRYYTAAMAGGKGLSELQRIGLDLDESAGEGAGLRQ